MSQKAFTIVELLVIIGVMVVVLTSAGSIMVNSFKVQNSTELNERVSAKAVYVLGELKKNVLNARVETIECDGDSIRFTTQSGGTTSLSCSESPSSQVASVSANGTYNFLTEGIEASNCDNFVSCELGTDGQVELVKFNLDLGMTSGNTVLGPWNFQGVVTPRN